MTNGIWIASESELEPPPELSSDPPERPDCAAAACETG
jgi:hypothetical protein